MSIRKKLILMVLAVVFFPVLLVSALTFHNYEASLKDSRISQLRDLAALKADEVEAYFAGLKLNLQILQSSFAVRESLPALVRSAQEPSSQEFISAKKILDDTWKKLPSLLGLSDIMLVSPEGRIVHSSNPKHFQNNFLDTLPEAGKDAFSEGRNQVYFSDIFLNKEEGNKPGLLISAPVYGFDDKFTGVIIFEVDMAPVYKIMQGMTGLGRTGEVLIGEKKGNEVVFLNPLRHDPQPVLKKSVTLGSRLGEPVQQAIQGKDGSGQLIDYRGTSVIAAWRYMPSFGWGLVAKMDADEAFAGLTRLKYITAVILVVILVITGVMVFLIAQSILRPIRKLSKDVSMIGVDTLNYSVDTRQRDEIGILSRSFAAMTQDLKKAVEGLDFERKRFAEVLNALPAYVVLLDSDHRVPFANRYFEERFGKSGGKRCYEYLFKRSEVCENCESYKAMETNQPHHWEWLGPDGRNYDIYDFPFKDVDGSPLILEMGLDITERKLNEAELEKHRNHLQELVSQRTGELKAVNQELYNILDSVPACIFYKDKKNCFLRVNSAFCKIMDRSKAELEGKCVGDIYPKEQADAFWKDDLEVIETGRPKTNIVEPMWSPQGEVLMLTDKLPYYDAQGDIVGVIGFSVDITERKRIEEALVNERNNLKKIFDVVSVGMLLINQDGQVTRVNNVVNRWIGKSLTEDCKDQPGNLLGCIHALNNPGGCGHTEHCKSCAIRKTFESVLSSGKPVANVEVESTLCVEGKQLNLWLDVSADPVVIDGKMHVILGLNNITERKSAEGELRKLNRTLMALIDSSQAMMRAEDESEYLNVVCKIIVETCGYMMVWIGFAEENEQKSVRPIAQAGFDEGYLSGINITWADEPQGRGPTGTAIRTAKPAFCRNMLTDPDFKPWRDEAVRRGYASSAVLPIISDNKVFGAISIYSRNPDPFSEEEINLLEELTNDVSYGIKTVRTRNALKESKEGLQRLNRELEKRVQERTRELQAASVYNRSLIEASLDPLVTIDINGKITDVNSAAEFATGVRRDELIGKNFSSYCTEPQKAQEVYEKVFREGKVRDYPLEIRHIDGHVTPVIYNATVYKDETGNATGVFAAARDIAELKKAEKALLEAQDEVNKAKRLSDIGTLAATVAHELRNPLAAIQMATYNIRRKAQNPLLDKHMVTIENKVDESEQIISNLLFYSRIKPPRYENVHIYKIINECVGLVRRRFAKERISLNLELNSIKRINIEVDPLQIKEVFINVLNNAYEAVEKNTGHLEVRADNSNGYISLTVKDNGSGISEEDLSRIFDPFFTTKAKGTGLGLTVCRQIIHFHGGEISVSSVKGKGTEVKIDLPLKKENGVKEDTNN